MIELVVFDMAGTTVHDADGVNTCLRLSLAAHGLTVDRDAVNRVMGLAKPVAIRALMEAGAGIASVTAAEVTAIHEDFVAIMTDFYAHGRGVREMDGAAAAFRALRARGIRVALDTGFDRAVANVVLNRLAWSEGYQVDTVVTSDEVRRGRPAPDLIFEAMRRLGVSDPARVAKVGDTPVDLEEGTAAGCGLVVGFTGGSHTRGELARVPHTHLADTLGEVVDLVRMRSMLLRTNVVGKLTGRS